MRPILVVGYGNLLRGDDGAGRRAAEELAAGWPAERVQVEPAHQLLVELAPVAAEADFVVFIDAERGLAPGEIRARPVPRSPAGAAPLTHHLTPETLLALADSLYGRRPDAVLVSIGAGSFEPGQAHGPEVRAAFPALLARVRDVVEARLQERSHA